MSTKHVCQNHHANEPGDLFKVEFATRFARRAGRITILLPHMRFVGGLLIVERRLQIVHDHLLMIDGRYRSGHRRCYPDPIGWAAISASCKIWSRISTF